MAVHASHGCDLDEGSCAGDASREVICERGVVTQRFARRGQRWIRVKLRELEAPLWIQQ
jgi:hypothetical protein